MLVLGISGSLRVGSYNTALLEAAAEMLPPTARLQLFGELGTLPPYSEDIDVEPAPPAVTVLRDAIANTTHPCRDPSRTPSTGPLAPTPRTRFAKCPQR